MSEDVWARESRLERLEEALDALRIASNEDAVPLLVEGDKDEAALRHLGMRGPIIKVHAGRGLFPFVEDLAREHREAILLVDWDRTGGRLAKRLREACAANGIKLDDAHRKALAFAVGGHVRTVESLDTHLDTLRRAPAPPDVTARAKRLAREEREATERDQS